MPKKEETTSNFNFSYGFLKQLADGTLTLIDRDIVQFTDRGFDMPKRREFQTAITTFSDFATDEQMEGIKMAATTAKDESRNIVERQMRSIFLAAKNVFGEGRGTYREFGNTDLTYQTDSELVRNANIMVATATKYVVNLVTEGITIPKIDLLNTSKINFDTAMDLQTQAIHDRDHSTERRAQLANDLYALVVKYNDVGKDIWVEESESKYNDFIIYNTVSGAPELLPASPHV
jgi:hypothetical protein